MFSIEELGQEEQGNLKALLVVMKESQETAQLVHPTGYATSHKQASDEENRRDHKGIGKADRGSQPSWPVQRGMILIREEIS